MGLGAGLLGLKAKGLDGSIGGLTEGSLELGLVGVLGGLDGVTAHLGLHGVPLHETGQLLDLLVGLLVVLSDLGSELVDLLLELLLGGTHVVHGVETHATDVGLHLGVLLGLLGVGSVQSSPHLVGGALKTVLGVGTVLGELLAHLAEGSVEGIGHGLKLGVNLLLVLVDELVELEVLLGRLLVTLVTELDHTGHLSVHVGVHLGLGGLVGTDNTGSLVDIVVHLGDLLGDSGLQLQKSNLVVSGGGGDLVLGL